MLSKEYEYLNDSDLNVYHLIFFPKKAPIAQSVERLTANPTAVVRSPVRADIFSGLLSTQQWWVGGLFRLSEVKAARKAMATYLTKPCA